MTRAITNSKIAGFDREWQGQSPFYEVWYGKVDLPDDRALWFRYKILDGSIQQASAWAVYFDGDKIHAGKQHWWLDDLKPPGPAGHNHPPTDLGSALRFQERSAVFRAGHAHLDDGNALGTAGPIQWDLYWRDSGRRHRFIPPSLRTIKVAHSGYDSCFADLRVSGRVTCHNNALDIEGATGMVGHIRGTKIAGHSWVWSHCNHFAGQPDALFEGLSARALLGGCGSPRMTGLFLTISDRQYNFHGPIQAFQTESSYDRHRWSFRAASRDAQLVGVAESADRVALVRYIDTDGSDLWCRNTKLGSLRLQLTDHRRGITDELYSPNRAAFETVSREPPVEDVLI